MALGRVKTWIPGDALTAGDLNAEFNNILNNALSLISPLSGTLAFSGTSPFSVANGQTLTVSIAAQTVGAATLTIPNFASVADTFAFTTLTQTLSNKTLSAPTFSGAYTLGGTPTFGATMAGASTFSGAITLSVAGTALTITNNAQIGSLGIGVAPSGTAGRLTVNENLIVSGAGSHAIGGATDAAVQFKQLGTFTGATDAHGFRLNSTLNPAVGGDSVGILVTPTLNKAGSGTHATFAGVFVGTPTIGAGASTLTNAVSLYVQGAPTAGTNNFALWVAGGATRIDSTTQTTVGAAGSASALPANPTGYLQINLGGTLRVVPFYAQS